MSKLSQSLSETDYVRDNDFYHESGDCVVLVDKTLFKIHRYRLASDGSAFGDMFDLPNGETCANSTTEDDPLILQDSVVEFRALCWALYALPLEIDTLNDTEAFKAKCKCIFNLFSISHKYHFKSLETWAGRLLVRHCTPRSKTEDRNVILTSPLLFENPELEVLLRLAIRTNLDALSEAVENALVDRVKDNVDDNVPLIRSLSLAEELGMRRFQGKLYYNELLKQESLQTGLQFPATSHTKELTEKQLLALFRGYWSLMHYWKSLPSIVTQKPLPLITPCTDYGHPRCQAIWENRWNADGSPLSFDPLGKLKKIYSSSEMGSKTQPCGPRKLSEITKEFQETLANHFLGPES